MNPALADAVRAALAGFGSATRLYAFQSGDGGADSLMVEAFAADDALQAIGTRDVILLSTDAELDLSNALGQAASLEISLADGARERFSGLISEAAMLGSFGGLARYRVRLQPWLWLLTRSRNSRVWQDKSVAAIVESIFALYAPLARWRWSDEAAPLLAAAGTRSYCCQYRETDADFVERLLTEEGLGWRIEEIGGEQGGHGVVLFANSVDTSATPEDRSSPIRYHGARAGEASDTIQAMRARRSLRAGLTTVLSYDYKAKQSVRASVPTSQPVGGARAPSLESYDSPGQYYYADSAQAQRYALLQMEAVEARRHLWDGRSTVRTLRAGTRFTLTQGPLQLDDGKSESAYVVLRVASVGVNNMPQPAKQGLAELFGPIPELLEEALPALAGQSLVEQFNAVIAQASASGYCNHFEAIAAATPWRPVNKNDRNNKNDPINKNDLNGLRHHPKPTAHGSQTAIVVGADGGDRAQGGDELYCDRLGRVRIRFHWQEDAAATCWVRVAQRSAGGGMGVQFLPRIGQEVLVQFIENDIDRPVIVGALYNGQGEGGQLPTPGGRRDGADDAAVFSAANDQRVAGQGNLAGGAAGNSPLWHGAAAAHGAHNNGAAQWGIRSKEFGGQGYNQLLFDDTDQQGRVQLASSHAATALNLGHLIHTADNYRGSLRGLGAELRTDAYGAVRAGAGLLVSSYPITHAMDAREPAGDNTAGIALMKQALTLGKSFSEAAVKHQTVAFASHLGARKADSSKMDEKAAPLQAMLTAVSGMLSADSIDAAQADAVDKPVAPGADKLPHTSSPVIGVSARAGLGVVAGQDIALSNNETISLMSGADSQFVTAGQLRMHSGQAIGMLGGAVAPGPDNIGMQLIAAQGAVDLQAQSDTLSVQARDQVDVVSANGHIDWAAAKSISLSTAGGANITIAGGNITVQCPGKITIHAGKKSFTGPATLNQAVPTLPRGALAYDEKFQLLDTGGDPIANMRYAIVKENGGRIEGITDAEGNIQLVQGFAAEHLKIEILGKVKR